MERENGGDMDEDGVGGGVGGVVVDSGDASVWISKK